MWIFFNIVLRDSKVSKKKIYIYRPESGFGPPGIDHIRISLLLHNIIYSAVMAIIAISRTRRDSPL